MKTVSKLMSMLMICVAIGTAGLAQDRPRDSGSKARGQAFKFWVSRSANAHARDNARSIFHYGRIQQAVPAVPVQEHLTAVRDNVQKSQKAISDLKKDNPENKEALASIARVDALHKKVLEHCDRLDAQVADGEGDSEEVCACCVDMHRDLSAADAEMEKLMKALKIEKLEVPGHEGSSASPEK
ncbi:MAG: hypothetical protein JNL58_27005 [Planctomyces sp.]|nr:hypothetical protein [Planctomyces sp.]